MIFKKIVYTVVLLLFSLVANAQETATVSGSLKNKKGKPLEEANIVIVGKASTPVRTDKNGKFSIQVPSNQDITIGITHIGYKTIKKKFRLSPNEKVVYNPIIEEEIVNIIQYDVEAESTRSGTMNRIDPKLASNFAGPNESFETLLKTLPGVSSNNELSSQYSVRGGNFDENLIYVNDIEIYRPFLIRSGRQEGLSFINPNLISDVKFSAGGFEAKYGDKMSSVLDVQYKEPEEFAGSVTFSLQGASLHLEGASDNHRFTHITGARYKSNQYVLQSLDTDGEYRPSFFDVQSYLTYDVSDKWEMGFLGNIALNRYNFIPQTRQTEFGTINQALQLTVAFEGQEIDQYQTYFGAFTNTFTPKDNVELKVISSIYRSLEDESFDIEGGYRIDELERDLSSDNFGDVAFNRGVGTFFDHARNRLDATVFNMEHKGKIFSKKHTTHWGVKYQREVINDKISEWAFIDSAGFFTPRVADSVGFTNPSAQPNQLLELNESLKSEISLNSNRYNAYIQRAWQWKRDTTAYTLTLGIRGAYWDFNDEFIISPRGSFSLRPNWKKDYLFRLSGGVYHQPPFYREMRAFDGTINGDIKSQRSYQVVLGSDHNFKAWGRPFKMVTELYYKYITNAIPYEVDNVRIRYFATNSAKAFTTGADFKINGEFVKGVESWFSMSILRSKEDLDNDSYVVNYNSDGEEILAGFTENDEIVRTETIEPGYIPRPTDQYVNFGLFFQDYIPKLPNFKMHITLLYGTGLPFDSESQNPRGRAAFRSPAYRRVDLGFSYVIKSEEHASKERKLTKHFNNIWVSAEIFNLLQVNNVISYLRVEDVTGRNYSIPNFLTSRQINLKFHFGF